MDSQVIYNIKNEALALIGSAKDSGELENIRITYLGRSGKLNGLFSKMSALTKEEKIQFGIKLNEVKNIINTEINSRVAHDSSSGQETAFDPTLPSISPPLGHLHPITKAIEEISNIFEKIGFIRVRYPEIDWDWYSFEALNMPSDHPARDEWETFFIDSPKNPKWGRVVLTPHTSNGQVREMERLKNPPMRMINIAKCYRRQLDISHTPMFHQFEGLLVDKNITISHLKGVTDYFANAFYGSDRKTRLRPFHFQFTEPSFEVDINCSICLGKGCKTCKSGWLELGGAGMVHPNVLRAGGIDPEIYSGFAFGWGIERTYMMKSALKLDDIRTLYNNDLRFLEQF